MGKALQCTNRDYSRSDEVDPVPSRGRIVPKSVNSDWEISIWTSDESTVSAVLSLAIVQKNLILNSKQCHVKCMDSE